jgi:hypothetical protein
MQSEAGGLVGVSCRRAPGRMCRFETKNPLISVIVFDERISKHVG